MHSGVTRGSSARGKLWTAVDNTRVTASAPSGRDGRLSPVHRPYYYDWDLYTDREGEVDS
jgi:hypothetical protein